MTLRYLPVAVAALFTVTACSTVTSGEPSTTAAPTSSAPQAARHTVAHPPPSERNNGTSFDPCEAFTDDDLRSVGLDPATIKATKSSFVRGCIWNGVGWNVQIGVLNGSVDRYLNQDSFAGAQPIVVGGLNGVSYRDEPGNLRSCYVELPSEKSTVGTALDILDPANAKIPDACTKAVEVATMLAPKLPK